MTHCWKPHPNPDSPQPNPSKMQSFGNLNRAYWEQLNKDIAAAPAMSPGLLAVLTTSQGRQEETATESGAGNALAEPLVTSSATDNLPELSLAQGSPQQSLTQQETAAGEVLQESNRATLAVICKTGRSPRRSTGEPKRKWEGAPIHAPGQANQGMAGPEDRVSS
uniref:Uncharacterized protein n=1 Tax=Sphaerodactylus townsendi TaxID=933632 RepID=A0ACB8F026_9SAUR